MKPIESFKIQDVPVDKMVFIATSNQDYSMDRTIFVEEWPTRADYVLIHGSHCSCYGFDDTEWEAEIYTREEIIKIVTGWKAEQHFFGDGSEQIIAPLILEYMSSDE